MQLFEFPKNFDLMPEGEYYIYVKEKGMFGKCFIGWITNKTFWRGHIKGLNEWLNTKILYCYGPIFDPKDLPKI